MALRCMVWAAADEDDDDDDAAVDAAAAAIDLNTIGWLAYTAVTQRGKFSARFVLLLLRRFVGAVLPYVVPVKRGTFE